MESSKIRQTGGEDAIQIGRARDVHIEVFREYGGHGHLAAKVDLPAYRDHLLSRLQTELPYYVPLKSTSSVVLLGPSLMAAGTHDGSVVDTIDQHPRLLLVAPAGFGKTATLLDLARRSLENAKQTTSCLCIYTELDRFRASKDFSPFECVLVMIGDTLHAAGACPTHPSLRAIQDLFRTGSCRLLLDGISDLPTSVQKICWHGIDDLAKRYPELRLVVTGRPQRVVGLPPAWRIASLCELDDGQIQEFLRTNCDDALASEVFEICGDVSLIRVPLFLKFAIALLSSDASRPSQFRSRCAMVTAYVQYVLERESVEKHARTPGGLPIEICHAALAKLATEMQSVSQSIELAQAKLLISQGSGQALGEPGLSRFLDDLVSRGLLRSDRRTVRFSHPVLQAYFHAEGLAERLRPGRQRKLPRWFKRVVEADGNRDQFMYLPAYVEGDRLRLILQRLLEVDPQAGIQVLSDIAFETGISATVETGIASLQQLARRAALISRLPRERRLTSFVVFVFLGCVIFFVPAGALAALIAAIVPEIGGWVSLLVGFSIGIGIVVLVVRKLRRSVGIRYKGASTVEGILIGARDARNPELRSRLHSVLEDLGRARMLRPVLRNMARKFAAADGDRPHCRDKQAVSPYLAVQEVAYIRGAEALNVLLELLAPGNIYSRFAINALLVRATIFPNERQQILENLRKIFNDQTTHWHLWNFLRIRLFMAGEGPAVPVQIWRRIGLRFLVIFLGAGITSILMGAAWTAVLLGSPNVAVWLVPALFHLILPLVVYADSRKLGALRIPKFFLEIDGCAAWQLGLLAVLCPPILASYPFYRPLIRRNALGFDWSILKRLSTSASVGI